MGILLEFWGIIVWGTATDLHHEKFKVTTSALPLQPGQDHGQELAISRSEKRMPAGEEGAAPARA